MAPQAINAREFLYTPVKTPFVWYPVTGRYKLNRILNGTFDSNLNDWNVLFGWVWASDGTAHAQADCVMNQLINSSQTQENIRVRVTVKQIDGVNSLLNLIIRNTVTGTEQTFYVTPTMGTGIYDFFGVGDEIEWGTSAGTTDIKIDNVEVYDANYESLLYQNRPYCKDECQYKLLTPSTAFLPFILVRPSSATSLTSIVCVHDDGTTISFDATEIAAIAALSLGTYTDSTGAEYDYVIYNGGTHGKYFKCGYWRGVAQDGAGNIWASEVFFIGNYGYGGRNQLGNGNFDFSNFLFWQVTGPWVWENGTAHIQNNGALIQDLGYNAPLRVKLKVLAMPGTQTLKIRIAENVTGANPTDLTITTPGNYTHEAVGGRVHISVTGGGAVDITIDEAEAYALNGDPNVCHTKLHWYNTCDLFNIPYSKGFLNILYLERKALTAAPEWKEEIEVVKDGVGREQQTAYRKWKEYLLDTGAIPEFIYDALGLLNVHNLKYISLPAETVQENIVIRNSSLKNSWLTGECYTNTELALIIEEVFDTQCCDEDWKKCLTACFDVVGFKEDNPSPDANTYYINHDDDKVELWDGTAYEEVECESGVVKNLATNRLMLHYTLGAPFVSDWYNIPHLGAVTDLTNNRYRLDAFIPADGCRSNIWVKDGVAGTWTIVSNFDPPAQTCAIAGVTCKTIVFFPATTDVWFRIDGFTHTQGCTYGFSNEVCVGAGCPV